MKNFYCISLFVFLSVFSHAQAPAWSWARQGQLLGTVTSSGESIATDAVGNVYVVGMVNDPDLLAFGSDTLRQNNFLVAYSASGNLLWVKEFTGVHGLYDIACDANNNVYLCGYTFIDSAVLGSTTVPPGKGFVVQLNSTGNVLWARYNDVQTSYAVACDAASNVYIAGWFSGNNYVHFENDSIISAGGYDVFVAKYDGTGNLQWLKQIGGTGDEGLGSIAVVGNGNFAVNINFGTASLQFGSSTIVKNPSASYNTAVAAFDAAGNELWAKSGYSTGNHSCYSIATDYEGNYVASGYLKDTTDLAFGNTIIHSLQGDEYFLVKYDSTGKILWARPGSPSSPVNSELYKNTLATDASGNIYAEGWYASNDPWITGNDTLPASSGYRVFLIKYDASGDEVWGKFAGNDNRDAQGLGVATGPGGAVYCTGQLQDTCSLGTDTLYLPTSVRSFFLAKVMESNPSDVSNTLTDEYAIRLFPNPASDKFTVVVSKDIKSGSLEIYNLVGERVVRQVVSGTQLDMDCAQLAKGLYFVKVSDGQSSHTLKVTVQ